MAGFSVITTVRLCGVSSSSRDISGTTAGTGNGETGTAGTRATGTGTAGAGAGSAASLMADLTKSSLLIFSLGWMASTGTASGDTGAVTSPGSR